MSRTRHHGKDNHIGHDYGGRAKCNKSYNNAHGAYGRQRLHEELRIQDKEIVMEELKQLEEEIERTIPNKD